jgi:hypothetical protein
MEPIEIRLSEVSLGETWLDFRLQLYNRNVFAKNPRTCEKVRIYAINEAYQVEARAPLSSCCAFF